MGEHKNSLIHENAPPKWYPNVGDYVEGKSRVDEKIMRGTVMAHIRHERMPAICVSPIQGCVSNSIQGTYRCW